MAHVFTTTAVIPVDETAPLHTEGCEVFVLDEIPEGAIGVSFGFTSERRTGGFVTGAVFLDEMLHACASVRNSHIDAEKVNSKTETFSFGGKTPSKISLRIGTSDYNFIRITNAFLTLEVGEA